MFIDGLDPTIRTVVQTHRDGNRKTTYLELVQHAKYEGDGVRARDVHHARGGARPVGVVRPGRRTVNHVRSFSDSGATTAIDEQTDDETFGYLGEVQDEGEVSHLSKTMTTASDDQEAFFALQARLRHQVPAPKVRNLGNPNNRPGLVDTRAPTQVRGVEGQGPSFQYLVCHYCYAHGHISPNCTLTIRQLIKVLENYGKLSPMRKLQSGLLLIIVFELPSILKSHPR